MNAMSPTPVSTLAKQLFSMTLPMLFGILSLMSFQLVDSAFIGQLGVLPLAAQGFTLPMQMIVIGLQVGLGIATTSLISKALGANQEQYGKQLAGLVLLVGAVGVLVLCLLIWLLREPLLALMGGEGSVMPIIELYWPWWLVSAWVGAMTYFFYSISRSNGNTMLPGLMMIVTSVANMVLDPIFIFTLDMGIVGAAVATILSFLLALVLVAHKVWQNNWVSFDFASISVPKSLAELGHIMGPAMVSQLLPPISSMLATKLIAGFGTAAVAAWAVGSRFEFFVIVTVLALTMSLPPMVGRLFGAKQFDEIQALVKIAVVYVLVFQTAMALITFLLATPIASLLSSEQDVVDIVTLHLLWVPLSLGPLGICMLMVSVANALGKAYRGLTISALRLFAFFLPCLWLGGELLGLTGIFIGAFIANVLAGANAWWMYQRTMALVKQNGA